MAINDMRKDLWEVAITDPPSNPAIIATDLSKLNAAKLLHFLNGGEEISWMFIRRILKGEAGRDE
jgi:hypothetical protein